MSNVTMRVLQIITRWLYTSEHSVHIPTRIICTHQISNIKYYPDLISCSIQQLQIRVRTEGCHSEVCKNRFPLWRIKSTHKTTDVNAIQNTEAFCVPSLGFSLHVHMPQCILSSRHTHGIGRHANRAPNLIIITSSFFLLVGSTI